MVTKNYAFTRIAALAAIGTLYLFIFYYRDYLAFPLFGDEVHFWPTVLQFSQEPIPSSYLLRNYPEVIAPLPFMIGGWVVHWFGPSIQYLRLLNLCLSFTIPLAFLWFSSNPKRFWIATLGLMLCPYFYFCSTIFYTDVITLAFLLVAWVLYLNRVHWLSGLFFIAAISSRQYAVVFPFAVLAYELWPMVVGFRLSNWSSSARWLRKRPYLLWYGLAGLSLVGWILFWGGLGPAPEIARQKYDATVHRFTYNPGFVLYACACLGLYYVLPEMVLTRKFELYSQALNHRKQLIGWIVLIIILIIFFPAEQMYDGFFVVQNLGFFDRHLSLIGIQGLSKQLIYGGLMLLTVIRFAQSKTGLASWVVLLSVLLMGKAHIGWDKYLLPTILTLWLLTLYDKHWPLGDKTNSYSVPQGMQSQPLYEQG